jgi:hypothetical protein
MASQVHCSTVSFSRGCSSLPSAFLPPSSFFSFLFLSDSLLSISLFSVSISVFLFSSLSLFSLSLYPSTFSSLFLPLSGMPSSGCTTGPQVTRWPSSTLLLHFIDWISGPIHKVEWMSSAKVPELWGGSREVESRVLRLHWHTSSLASSEHKSTQQGYGVENTGSGSRPWLVRKWLWDWYKSQDFDGPQSSHANSQLVWSVIKALPVLKFNLQLRNLYLPMTSWDSWGREENSVH